MFEEETKVFDPEIRDEILAMFKRTMGYDPEKNTYSAEKYQKRREVYMTKSDGKTASSEATKLAIKKFREANREELNRQARERYQRKKLEKLRANTNNVIEMISVV